LLNAASRVCNLPAIWQADTLHHGPIPNLKESHMNRSNLTVHIVAAALSVLGSAAQLGLVAAALAIAVASTGAHAAATPAAVVVRYGELDLSRPAAVALLYGRIDAAARKACGDAQRVGSHLATPNWLSCVSDSVERAVATVDQPELTAYHASRTSSPRATRNAPAQRNGRD
jgi:UrcA family protein